MGTLTAMKYPTNLAIGLADHTYVQCCDAKGWGCWGGKAGGTALRSGSGSSRRAEAIAGADEKAGIKCYLVNGVCHQAANRILLPAGITVRGARGYSVSEAMFGTYGRVGFWPCRSPFHQHAEVSGDLSCVGVAEGTSLHVAPRSFEARGEWQYIQGVLEIYGDAQKLMKTRSVDRASVERVHLALFMYMAGFNLGRRLDKPLTRTLTQVRRKAERRQTAIEKAFATGELSPAALAGAIDGEARAFQDDMAGALDAEAYAQLFDLQRDERIVLADPEIVEATYPGR